MPVAVLILEICMVSCFLLMSKSSFNAKSAQYELVLSAGINRIALGQIQTKQD